MSDFRFACPHCGQRISGETAYRGREIPCPNCQQTIKVPTPAAKSPAVAAASLEVPESARPGGKLEPLALISFVCSLGLVAGSMPGIVCGHLARKRIGRNPALGGKRLATLGLIISYVCLLASLAVFSAWSFVLVPKQGRQLDTRELEANTEAVLAARRVDQVKMGDWQSEAEHQLRSRTSGSAKFSDRMLRHAFRGGFFSYVMKVDPSHPMSLYCTYWGNDGEGRRFDVIVNDEIIATQTLDYNAPGRFFDVEYAIPQHLTRNKTNVTVVFQGYPGKTVGGIFGCQMLKSNQ
jgi:hypothetical protein